MTTGGPRHPAHCQSPYALRFEWGLSGAEAVAMGADIAVVVDVLSFTTTLSVALDRGVIVYPWATRDDTAAAVFARDHDAVLAVARSNAHPGEISLSPATLRGGQSPQRLVLPSPNGSTIAFRLADGASLCLGASLRNAPAVASWIAANAAANRVVAIVAAGERWPNGELRPSVEDLWGGGFVATELERLLPNLELSPEARVAADAWAAVSTSLPMALNDSASGRELISAGYQQDVRIAAELGTSQIVPILRSGAFVDAHLHGQL